MSMTKRDKTFLLVVVIIVTLVVAYLAFIKPEMGKVTSAKASVESAQKAQDEIKAKIAKIKTVEAQIKKEFENASAYNEVFFKDYSPIDIDHLMQGELDKNMVVFSEFKIAGPKAIDLAPYQFVPQTLLPQKDDKGKTDAQKTDTQKTDTKSADDKKPADTSKKGNDIVATSDSITAYTVEVNFKSYKAGFDTFLTDLCQRDNMSIVVNEIAWDTKQDKTKLMVYDAATGASVYAPLQDGLISGTIKMTLYYKQSADFLTE